LKPHNIDQITFVYGAHELMWTIRVTCTILTIKSNSRNLNYIMVSNYA
jgi:hypothetical protein